MGGKRGRLIAAEDKATAIVLIEEACAAGARVKPACEVLQISVRTLQRWKKEQDLEDKRHGPHTAPANKFSEAEVEAIFKVINSPEYCDYPPSQIVPKLADQGLYIASESTMYRLLHKKKMMRHRNASRPKIHRKPDCLKASSPNKLWSWDITYLPSTIRGQFFYLYMFMDVYSRKVVGFDVYESQASEDAAVVIKKAYIAEGIKEGEVTLHSDNGGPMKGSMMLATLEKLGVAASFSRPAVSNDNAFSESLFKTLKYRPEYPSKPFKDIASALSWVSGFVDWYNNKHQHSGLKFVTPALRHENKDGDILKKRENVYELARQKHPSRWSGNTRNWSKPGEVYLNGHGSERKCS